MLKIFITLANFLGVIGILICGMSGTARVFGFYQLAGYECMTIFIGGMGLMLASMLLKQELILWKTHTSTS
tara:strand:+ start:4497 stop:4709 length:213 start_codon:yes stop_codon:yes gene_type:complete